MANQDNDDRNYPAAATTVTENAAIRQQNQAQGTNNQQFRPNPLGFFSSYTYNLTLYICTPRALNNYFSAFEAGLPFNIDSTSEFYVVAQSGGVNNRFENRAMTLSGLIGQGEPGYDYFIEDLKIKQVMPTRNGAQVPTDDSEFEFKIVEPTGFNFTQQLIKATAAIASVEPELYVGTCSDAYNQFYMLGVRFYGYDADGTILTAKQAAGNDQLSGITNQFAMFERFFPIQIKTLKFKLDGRATTYNIDAAPITTSSVLGTARNPVNNAVTVNGATTVAGALNGLVDILNQDQRKQVTSGPRTLPNRYRVEFTPSAAETIGRARLTNRGQIGLESFTNVKNVTQITAATSARAATIVPGRTVSIAAGQPISQAITDIIVGSDYITGALKRINDSNPQPGVKNNTPNREFQWFTITPKIRVLGFDGTTTNDWVYEITYLIQEYAVPFTTSSNVDRSSQFYGVQKRYNYWYTGENTEVIALDFTYDNAYYEVVRNTLEKIGLVDNQGVPRKRQVKPNNGGSQMQGGLLQAGGYNQDVGASIMSPADNTTVNMRILGDPDFLMTTTSVPYVALDNQNYLYSNRVPNVYGPGQQINPMRGQIFAEIVFNGASDYDNGRGTMELFRPIKLYESPDIAGVYGLQGYLYQINFVTSIFNRGSFTQQLEGVIVLEQQLLNKIQENQAGPPRPAQRNTASAGTLPKYCEAGVQTAQNRMPANTAAQQTNTQGVLDDDARRDYERRGEAARRMNEGSTVTRERTQQSAGSDQFRTTETDAMGTMQGVAP